MFCCSGCNRKEELLTEINKDKAPIKNISKNQILEEDKIQSPLNIFKSNDDIMANYISSKQSFFKKDNTNLKSTFKSLKEHKANIDSNTTMPKMCSQTNRDPFGQKLYYNSKLFRSNFSPNNNYNNKRMNTDNNNNILYNSTNFANLRAKRNIDKDRVYGMPTNMYSNDHFSLNNNSDEVYNITESTNQMAYKRYDRQVYINNTKDIYSCDKCKEIYRLLINNGKQITPMKCNNCGNMLNAKSYRYYYNIFCKNNNNIYNSNIKESILQKRRRNSKILNNY